MLYKNIDEIKRANKAIGHHFFDKGNDEFFNGQTYPQVYGGRYFVTSHQFIASDGEAFPEEYLVRKCEDDGSITTMIIDHGTDEARPTVGSLIAARAYAIRFAEQEEGGE